MSYLLTTFFSYIQKGKVLLQLFVFLSTLSAFQLLAISFAQSYSGSYAEVTHPSNELILTYEGNQKYSGVLFEGIGIYSIEANEENDSLTGIIIKSRSSSEQDLAFVATLNDGLIQFKTNPINNDGGIDTNSQSETTYARPSIRSVTTEATTQDVSNTSGIQTSAITIDNNSDRLSIYPVHIGTLTGEHIQADQQYWGGTQLQIPQVGLAFQIPSAGTALHTTPQESIIIGHTSTLGNVAITALSTANFDSFITSQLNTSSNETLNFVSGPIKTEDSYRAAYEFTSDTRTSYIEVAAQKGPDGNIVILKAKSRLQEAEDISLVVDMLLESLVFSEVTNISLQTDLSNKRINTPNEIIDICSTNEFRLENTSNPEDIQIGLWKATSSIFSSGLALTTIDGNFHYLPLENKVGTLENDNIFSIEASPYCP